MNAAILKANETLDSFNSGLTNPKAESQALKVQFSNSSGIEHMWVGDVILKNGKYSGILNNDPEYVKEYRSGDQIIHASAVVRIDPIDQAGIVSSSTGIRTHQLRTIRRVVL